MFPQKSDDDLSDRLGLLEEKRVPRIGDLH